MQTVAAGPSANSAQKFTACDSDRFDWLRPSGRSIFAADVATASPSRTRNSHGCGSRRNATATLKHAAPATTTAVTYARAAGGSVRSVGTGAAAVIAQLRRVRARG